MAGLPPVPRAPNPSTRYTPRASSARSTCSKFRRKPRRSSHKPSAEQSSWRRPEPGAMLRGSMSFVSESDALHARVQAYARGEANEDFDALALALAAYQRNHSPGFARLVQRHGSKLDTLDS